MQIELCRYPFRIVTVIPFDTLTNCSSTAKSKVLKNRMNRSGGEAFARLAQQLNRARMQAAGGGRGGSGGNGGQPGFKGFMAGGGALVALAAGGILINYSLFNGKLSCRRCLSDQTGRKLRM